MHYHASARTDLGCVRQNNEDAFLSDPEQGLFVVCDGMGGHAAGEIASGLATRVVGEELAKIEEQRRRFATEESETLSAELIRAVEDAVQSAGRAIYEQAQAHSEQAGMGTTCSLIVLAGRKGILAHVGDSRVYVVRNKALYQLSEDHTYVAEQVRRGLMTKEQAAKSKRGNVLTRALGPVESMPVDTMLFDVDPRDRFLLCSDGLHQYFKDSTELLRTLVDGTPAECVERIVDMARARGGHDNITAVIVDIEDAVTNEDDEADSAAQRISVLKRVPMFQHMSYQELVRLIRLMQVKTASPGEVLIQEDQIEDKLFINLYGELEVSKGGTRLATVPAGGHVGEMALIDKAPRSATVTAQTTCRLLVMDRARFHEVIRKEPVVATKMLWTFTQELSRRLRDTNESLKAVLDQQEIVPFVESEE